MNIEREGPAPEPQEQQTSEYEFQSEHGEKITNAVNGAVEHQKTLSGWSDEAEEFLKNMLSRTFDAVLTEKNDSINNVSMLDIDNLMRSISDREDRPYEYINQVFRKKYGTTFSFKIPAQNTLGLLQNDVDSVEELQRLKEKSRKYSDSSGKSSFRFDRQ